MKNVAIVQARVGSTRFPNKVMQRLGDTPLIGVLINRLEKSSTVDEIMLATSDHPGNDELARYAASRSLTVFRGSEYDVLDRYYRAAEVAAADVIIRITGDCPLVDAAVVDAVVRQLHEHDADYASNTAPPTYPDGLDVEAFTYAALREAWQNATDPFDREHVTPYLKRNNGFKCVNVEHDQDYSRERWTVDEPEDFQVIKRIFDHFEPRGDFSWLEVIALRAEDPQLFMDNQHILRDEGASLGTGQKLWHRAKRVIPGGNMFLSKRSEMWLPGQWPAYFSRAKGCRVWDLDGREYLDMSIMAIGTNTLGYGHPEVDDAVRRTIDAGNMSTLNCPEEVYLAERLIELHPWAEMVRLARTGGEANAIAVRIARAASGKDQVAFCGYHGWHDWYLAANLGDSNNLAGHLLSGLDPNGVPAYLKGSIAPFEFNRIDQLETLICDGAIGVIVMEVSRNYSPSPDFLRQVRTLATENGIVLMFDECTSGFRQTFGGLHKLYGVEPDMAVFGKALGNGYAITALIGRRSIMEAAQGTFISSTFWSERIGPSAALKTLEVMEREQSWEQITETGRAIMRQLRELADAHGIALQVTGLPALLSFSFDSPNSLKYKTLLTQEMLKRGILATTGVYVCTEHREPEIATYFNALDDVFALIRKCEDGADVTALLDGPVCHAGFKRLN